MIYSWQLHYIQSEFKGQLPQPYASGPQATQIIPANMNDQNLEEPSRYVSRSRARRHLWFDADASRASYQLCIDRSLIDFVLQVDVRQCQYLVDLDTEEETPLEPRYSANKEEWSVVAHKPFLQASRYFPKRIIARKYVSDIKNYEHNGNDSQYTKS